MCQGMLPWQPHNIAVMKAYYQFGFRKNYSTTLAVIDVVDEIYEHLDKGEIGLGIYLDLTKAFDTVSYTHLTLPTILRV